ncbi:type IV secretion system DNA-binding domain-containing protein [Pirellulales bacterium]|nr:type IV secretion system DNA-binding domain-containing protein [Pirellulales bacterium]
MEWWLAVRFVAAILFLGAVIIIVFLLDPIWRWVNRYRYTRGAELDRHGKDVIRPGERKWGTHGVSPAECRNHFLAAGRSDSGKSLLMQRLMADVVTSVTPGSDRRVLMYDAKNELVPYLMKLGVTAPVYSVNPLEKRTTLPNGVKWAAHLDVDCCASAENFSYKIIAEDTGQNRFFSDGARLLVARVCESFARHNAAGDGWDFSDVVYACLCPKRLVSVLERDEVGMEALEGLMKESRTAYQVFVTLFSRMSRFRPSAGMNQRAQQGISIRRWVTEESILLFSSNARTRHATDPLYELIFSLIVECTDELHDCTERETWCFLDEIRLCEPVIRSDMLNYFATKARSKGGILALGFQSYSGLKKVLGEDLAQELCAQCQNQAYLWFTSIEDAKWAAAQCGEKETLETLRSFSGAAGSRNRTASENRLMKQAILPSEFLAFGKPSPERGIKGVFIKAGEHPKLRVVPGREFPFVCTPQEKREHGIHRRDRSEQELLPWPKARERELGINVSRDNLTLEERRERFRKNTGHEQRSQETGKLIPSTNKQARDHETYAGAQKAAERFSQTLDVSFGI